MREGNLHRDESDGLGRSKIVLTIDLNIRAESGNFRWLTISRDSVIQRVKRNGTGLHLSRCLRSERFSVHSHASRHHWSRKQDDYNADDLKPQYKTCPFIFTVTDFRRFVFAQGFVPANISDRGVNG